MTTALITPPASEPISLADAKLHLRIDHDHEDALLTETIKAARQYTELSCGQKLITQAWRQYESQCPVDRRFVLRVTPIQSIVAVTVFDFDGVPSVLAVQDILLQNRSEIPYLQLTEAVGPLDAANGLEIDLIAGMGDFAIDVPDTLKRAILLLVAHWYEFRGAIPPSQQPVSIPPGFEALMQPYRRIHL